MFWDGKMQKISNHHNSCVGVKKVERWMKQKETIKNLSNMKATKIISACAVLAALASCSNEHELSQQSAEDTPIRIQANVGGITTRAASDIQSQFFEAGEIIGIFLKEHLESGQQKVATYTNPIEGTVNTTTQTNIDLATPQYFPANGRGVDCLAIYPKDVANNPNSFSVQENQSGAANYKASDLMYAYTANTAKGNDIELTFKHLLSKIIVEVKADDSVNPSVLSDVYVDLCNTNKTIGITVDDIAQGYESAPKSVSVSGNPSTPANIVMGKPGVSDSDSKKTNEVAAIIVPQTIANTNTFIQVRLNNGTENYATYNYTPSANVTFKGSKSYKYTITLKAGAIEVSNVTITDWSYAGNTNGEATLD